MPGSIDDLPPDIAAVARLFAEVRVRILKEEQARRGPIPVVPPASPVTADPLKLLMKLDEVAKALSISRTKVYELIASGEIPSIRVGRSVRVSVDELRAWIRRKHE